MRSVQLVRWGCSRFPFACFALYSVYVDGCIKVCTVDSNRRLRSHGKYVLCLSYEKKNLSPGRSIPIGHFGNHIESKPTGSQISSHLQFQEGVFTSVGVFRCFQVPWGYDILHLGYSSCKGIEQLWIPMDCHPHPAKQIKIWTIISYKGTE